MFGMGLGMSAKTSAITDFISIWETTLDNESITIPTVSNATYACKVDWGDGAITNPTRWDDLGMTHEYAIAGNYVITISGIFGAFHDTNGNPDKLISVSNLGALGLTSLASAFTSNKLVSFTSGYSDITGVTSLLGMFHTSSVATIDLTGFDTSNITDMQQTFSLCPNLINLDLTGFDTSNVTNMTLMFDNSEVETLDVTSFDTTSVETMPFMFRNAVTETLDVTGFDTINVTNMSYVFFGADALDINPSGFNIESVTTLENMFLAAGMTTVNYDATLIAWEAQNYPIDMSVNFGSSKYTLGGVAEAARNALVANGWTIIDGGGI